MITRTRIRTSGNPLVLFIIAIVFTIVGGIFTASNIAKSKACTAEVDATISYIKTTKKITRRNGKRKTTTSHEVYIDYSYNGLDFDDVPLGYYSSGMYEGDIVSIKVNPDKPSEIFVKGSFIVGFIFLGIGILFLVLSISLIVGVVNTARRIPIHTNHQYENNNNNTVTYSKQDISNVQDRLNRL